MLFCKIDKLLSDNERGKFMIKTYKKLFSFVPEGKWLAYLAILLAAISSLLMVGALYDFYRFLQELILSEDAEAGFQLAVQIIYLMGLGVFCYFVAGLLTHIVAFRLETNLRKVGIDGLERSNFSFFNKMPSGKIRKIIDDNAAEIHAIVAHLIPDITAVVVTPIVLLWISFKIHWILGLLLILLILLGVALVGGMIGNKELMGRYMEALENLNASTVEYVRGIQVIKIFQTSVSSFRILHDSIQSYADQSLDYSFSCRTAYVLFQLLLSTYVLFALPIFALLFPLQEQVTFLPQLIFFYSIVGIVFNSFMRVMYLAMYQYKANSSVSKIEDLVAEMTADRTYEGEQEELKDASIEFKNVSFDYDGKQVLDHLSFKLEAGRVYALVGSSGSGKSTIAKLIAGFYKVSDGEVLLGGVPLANYSQDGMMKHLAFVFQQAKLFKMSIFDNVKIGNPNASREEVMRALELASCQDILDKFPEREATLIGAKHVHLSGGEMQRIAIARAILKDAAIIILDEASAATDVNNEYHIQKAFANLIEGKTVIIIAHRLSSIKGVDEILVVENGRIVERGSEEALSKQAGRYQELKELYQKANEWRLP